ncbi:MAG: hypothetical protein IFJ96_00785 [Acidobacteria bacterium]|nr:hypothetical protein [Candidatus Sulfomarinibacter sp. MAG AM2]
MNKDDMERALGLMKQAERLLEEDLDETAKFDAGKTPREQELEGAATEAARALELVLAMDKETAKLRTKEEIELLGALRSYHVKLDPNAKDQIVTALHYLQNVGIDIFQRRGIQWSRKSKS